ncbi:hypothetical protein ACJX0J_001905, partial (mitochondrion) [Zea mays]
WKNISSLAHGTTSMCTLFSGQEALNIFRSSPNHLAVKMRNDVSYWKERISILRDLLIYPLAFKEWNIYQAPSTISDSIYGSTFFLSNWAFMVFIRGSVIPICLYLLFINVLKGRSLADASIDSRMIQAFSRASSKRMKTMKIWFLTLFVWGPIFQYGYWLRFHFHVIDFSYGNVSFFPWGEQARTHAMIAVSTLLYIPLHIKARAIVYYFRFGD